MTVAATSFRSYVLPIYRYYQENGPTARIADNRHERLARFLVASGLTYGYASYWNANVETVVSSGRVAVRPVILDALPKPMIHISSAQWYTPAAHEGTTFLLLEAGEDRHIDMPRLVELAGPPVRSLQFDGYTVLVFARNFASTLPGFDFLITQPTIVRFGAQTPHKIGGYVGGAGDGSMEARSGEAGFLVYGPYIALGRGRYVAEYEVAGCSDASASPGSVDVSAFVNGIPTVVAAAPIPAGTAWQRIAVPFDLATPGVGMEFRVQASGSGCLRARSLTLRRATSRPA